MPSISTSTVSPFCKNSGGFRAYPTPSGVPVAMTSPASDGQTVGELCDDRRDREDHRRRRRALLYDAVDTGHERQCLNIGHFIGRDNERADRTASVKRFSLKPLVMSTLKIARRQIVDARIAEDDSKRIFFGDIACRSPDDDTELPFPIILARHGGGKCYASVRVGHRVWRFGEKLRHLWDRDRHALSGRTLGDVLAIITADAKDVLRRLQRRTKRNIGECDRFARALDEREPLGVR